jgi:hypothetical protein
MQPCLKHATATSRNIEEQRSGPYVTGEIRACSSSPSWLRCQDRCSDVEAHSVTAVSCTCTHTAHSTKGRDLRPSQPASQPVFHEGTASCLEVGAPCSLRWATWQWASVSTVFPSPFFFVVIHPPAFASEHWIPHLSPCTTRRDLSLHPISPKRGHLHARQHASHACTHARARGAPTLCDGACMRYGGWARYLRCTPIWLESLAMGLPMVHAAIGTAVARATSDNTSSAGAIVLHWRNSDA